MANDDIVRVVAEPMVPLAGALCPEGEFAKIKELEDKWKKAGDEYFGEIRRVITYHITKDFEVG